MLKAEKALEMAQTGDIINMKTTVETKYGNLVENIISKTRKRKRENSSGKGKNKRSKNRKKIDFKKIKKLISNKFKSKFIKNIYNKTRSNKKKK